jgi:hypothetical protein
MDICLFIRIYRNWRGLARWAAVLLLVCGVSAPVMAQGPSVSIVQPSDSSAAFRRVSTVAGPQYGGGPLHRFLFGGDYRSLWTAPIQVDVLDLRTYAGGLRPVSVGGGEQTHSLHLRTSDGRIFAFRSVDKDLTRALPPDLRGTLVHDLVQDQVSAAHPVGALVVAPLLDAAGVRHAVPRLFVMPDDSSLGQFRRRFSGMLGMLEEYPTEAKADRPGFQGARNVIETVQLFERIDGGEEIRVDTRAFLTARLMDNFIGDWDRGPGQWLWMKATSGNDAPWEPIPNDRDQAFSRYSGVLLGIARHERPVVRPTNFGNGYSHLFALNWNGRLLDRRLLTGLDWEVWDSVAHRLQARLTDSVIDRAVARLPRPYYREDGARLARALKARRDRLPNMARQLYHNLAQAAEVHTSDASETITAVRWRDGTLDLTIPGHFHRRFQPGETKEVRVMMRGGDDSVQVTGGDNGPTLRIIGGTGAKVVQDEAAGGRTRVYPGSAAVTVAGANRPSVDRRPYDTTHVKVARRDAGNWWQVRSRVSSQPDAGLTLGSTVSLYRYGFRRNPYAFRLDMTGAYARGADGYLFEVDGDRRLENSGTHFLFQARASSIDVLRYYGPGNNSADPGSSHFYRAYESQYSVVPAIGFSIAPRATVSVGPVLKYWSTDFDRATLLTRDRPYGSGDFGQVGGQMAFSFDTRDTIRAPRRGVHLNAGGSVYPSVWDVASTFGEAHGDASTYLTAALPLQPTLALRAGGKKVWGTFPFQEGALIGGNSTVRGLRNGRYLGDAAAYGNAELRLHLYDFGLPVPGELGVFGLADAGRVWVEGESPDGWHHAFGGGIWMDWMNRRNTLSLAVARSEGRNGFYLTSGFMF